MAAMISLDGQSAALDDMGKWTSADAQLARLLNAFCDFYERAYGPDKGFWQGYMLGLLEAKLGAAVDWATPTPDELEAEAEFEETGLQRVY